MAYLTLYPGAKRWAGPWRSAETLLNYAIIIFGFYVLVAGCYVRQVSFTTLLPQTDCGSSIGINKEYHHRL